MEIETAMDSLADALHLTPASASARPMLTDGGRELPQMVDIGERRLGVDEAARMHRRITRKLGGHVAAAEQVLASATASQRFGGESCSTSTTHSTGRMAACNTCCYMPNTTAAAFRCSALGRR